MKRFLCCLFILSVSGCAMSYGPAFQMVRPSPGKSMIYVYRSPSITGSAMSAMPMVFVDDVKYRKIKNGGYISIELEPGMHEVILKNAFFGKVLESESGRVPFSIEPGQVKYFEYAQITVGYNTYGSTQVADVKTHFLQVPGGYALKRLKKTKHLKFD